MNVKINDNLFSVKPVLTSKDIQNGMMGKKFDGTFDGMLFLMKNGPHSFWMKNCIVHFDGNQITKIHHNCKPCHTEDCESYKGNGDMILELPGGDCKKYDIKEGDLIDLQP
jgi:uncharacterized membrane protein (UPF0127 family)